MLLPNPVEMLLQRARSEPEKPYLHQPVGGIWKSYTWSDVADQVRRMATALQNIGLSRGARVAITGINTARWFMADLACGMSGMVSVGLYPRQRDSNTRHVLAHSGCQAVFLGPMANIHEFLGVLPGDRRMAEVMAAQDCLYTLVVKYPDGTLEPPPPRVRDAIAHVQRAAAACGTRPSRARRDSRACLTRFRSPATSCARRWPSAPHR